MIKAALKNSFVQNVLAFLANLYIRIVFATSRWRCLGFDIPETYRLANKPFIACFWHSRLLLLPYAWKGEAGTFFMLISDHKDGRLISKTVDHFGIKTISGSTKRGGMQAVLSMVRLSQRGKTIGITPDGPQGPAFAVSEGTIMTSYLAKTDLIPVTYSVKHHKILKTWDRFFLPCPFSHGVLMWGPPIAHPKTKAHIKRVKNNLQNALDQLNIKADKEAKAAHVS